MWSALFITCRTGRNQRSAINHRKLNIENLVRSVWRFLANNRQEVSEMWNSEICCWHSDYKTFLRNAFCISSLFGQIRFRWVKWRKGYQANITQPSRNHYTPATITRPLNTSNHHTTIKHQQPSLNHYTPATISQPSPNHYKPATITQPLHTSNYHTTIKHQQP